MKKRIILITAISILLSTISFFNITAMGEAATSPEATLLFEMGISGEEGGMPTVTAINGTASNVDTTYETGGISLAGTRGSADTPIYHEYKLTDTSAPVPYLTFGKKADGETSFSNTGSRVAVKMTATDIAMRDKITVETWIRNMNINDGAKKVMVFGKPEPTTTGRGDVAFKVQWNPASQGGLCMYPDAITYGDAGSNHGLQDQLGGKWSHIVITREWNKEETISGDGKGYWTSTLFVNGVKGATNRIPATGTVVKTDYTSTDADPWQYIAIGGDFKEGAQAFRGDIATFKLYDGALSHEEAQSRYYAERANFMVITDVKDIAELEADTKTFKVSFTDGGDDVDGTTVTNDNIYIENSEGTKLKSQVGVYDEAEKSVTLTISGYLGYGETYKLYVGGVKTVKAEPLARAYGVIKTKNSPYVTSAPEISKTETSASVSIPVSATDGKKFTLAMAVLDADARIVKVLFDNIAETGTLALSTGDILQAGYTVKAIAWVTDDTGIKPISAPIILK